MTAYCTADDVRLLTGITSADTSDTVITSLIAVAQTRVEHRLDDAGVSLPIETIPDALRIGTAHLTAALLIRRKAVDLSRPNSLGLEGLSVGVNTAEDEQYYAAAGLRYVEVAIAEILGDSRGRAIIDVVVGE